MADENKNPLLNGNPRIVPATIRKVKPYKKVPSQEKPDRNSMDKGLNRVFGRKIFFVRIKSSLQTAQWNLEQVLEITTVNASGFPVREM